MKHFNQKFEGFAPDGKNSHSPSPAGPLTAVQDVMHTLHEFWHQSLLPTCGVMAQTISVLWGEWLIPLMTKRLKNGRQRAQGKGLRSRYPAVPALPSRELSSESTLTLRKIHGSLSQNWSSAIERPIRVQKAAHSEWATAQRGMSRLASRSTVRNATPPARPSSTSIDPAEKAAIRGLDDIFTRPVNGLLLDEFQALAPAMAVGRSAEQASAETPPPVETVMPRPIAIHPTAEMTSHQPIMQASAVNPPDHSDGKTGSLEHRSQTSFEMDAPQSVEALQSVLREETRAMSHKVKLLAESAKNWLQRKSTPSLSPVWDVALSGEAGLEGAMVGPVPDASDLPASNYQVGVPVYQDSPATSKTRWEPLPVTPALDDDLTAVNYMVQNNRILSRSISNLVDQYFDQAAKEEPPDYY